MSHARIQSQTNIAIVFLEQLMASPHHRQRRDKTVNDVISAADRLYPVSNPVANEI